MYTGMYTCTKTLSYRLSCPQISNVERRYFFQPRVYQISMDSVPEGLAQQSAGHPMRPFATGGHIENVLYITISKYKRLGNSDDPFYCYT